MGDWKFDKNVAPIFDEHVRLHVPQYEEIHRMIAEISEWFVEEFTNVYDIGTSTGQVLSNLYDKHNNKVSIEYIGHDTSKDMLNIARNLLGHIPHLTLTSKPVEDSKFEDASFIVSMLTMQFITPNERQQVINKIYDGLNKGGGFVLVEKIIGNNARFNEMFIEMYHQMKIDNGLTEKQVIEKSKAIRGVLKPYTIQENIEMLENAGFESVDMFFKWGNFAGFLASKN